MTPNSRFRFTYVDPDEMTPTTTTTVPVPIGWKDAAFSLTRDPGFYSLVEYFKGSFTWYGEARRIIKLVKANEGNNGKIEVKIDLDYGSGGFVNEFTGQLDLSQTEDLSKGGTFYKITCPIIRNDLWAKFINRRSIPIDLQSTTDLDGGARTAVNKFTLPLPAQLVRKTFDSLHTGDDAYALTAALPYGAVDWRIIVTNEITERFQLQKEILAAVPNKLFQFKFGGVAAIDCTLYLSTGLGGGGLGVNQVANIEVYIQINNGTPTAFTKTNLGTNGVDGRTEFTYSASPAIVAGDTLKIYIQNTAGANNTVYWLDFYSSGLTIVQDTDFSQSSTDAYLLKDAFESVLSKIVGADSVLVSNLLDSCVGKIATMRGKHLRGLLFSSKELSVSFNDLWEGFHPLGFAGLGYTSNANEIEIESIEEFYGVAPVVFISNASISQNKDEVNLLYKKIDVGFSKWSAESNNGLDDIQTVSTYRSYLKTVGVDYGIRSSAFMAALGIEEARRQSENSKDYKLDEDLIFIAVKDDGGGSYEPEVGTDFGTITGVTNSDTRYNLRHTPANILKRWELWVMQFLLGTGEDLIFSKGEGNYQYNIEFELTDCETNPGNTEINGEASLSEGGALATIEKFTVTCAMGKDTYNAIKNNRKEGIAISSGTSAYKLYFIEDLEWQHYHGRAVIQVRKRNDTELEPENVILMEDGNYILQEDSTQIPLES